MRGKDGLLEVLELKVGRNPRASVGAGSSAAALFKLAGAFEVSAVSSLGTAIKLPMPAVKWPTTAAFAETTPAVDRPAVPWYVTTPGPPSDESAFAMNRA